MIAAHFKRSPKEERHGSLRSSTRCGDRRPKKESQGAGDRVRKRLSDFHQDTIAGIEPARRNPMRVDRAITHRPLAIVTSFPDQKSPARPSGASATEPNQSVQRTGPSARR